MNPALFVAFCVKMKRVAWRDWSPIGTDQSIRFIERLTHFCVMFVLRLISAFPLGEGASVGSTWHKINARRCEMTSRDVRRVSGATALPWRQGVLICCPSPEDRFLSEMRQKNMIRWSFLGRRRERSGGRSLWSTEDALPLFCSSVCPVDQPLNSIRPHLYTLEATCDAKKWVSLAHLPQHCSPPRRLATHTALWYCARVLYILGRPASASLAFRFQGTYISLIKGRRPGLNATHTMLLGTKTTR